MYFGHRVADFHCFWSGHIAYTYGAIPMPMAATPMPMLDNLTDKVWLNVSGHCMEGGVNVSALD